MSASDGYVVGAFQVVDHGPPSLRWNLVLVSEGYRAEELPQFAAAVQHFVDVMFSTPPFDTLRCGINVYRIDVASTESGADDPAACGGSGSSVATYFDAAYCNWGLRRALQVRESTVFEVANAHTPQWHQLLVLVNSPISGGTGGSIGVLAAASGWEETALHELGHSAFGLDDEYPYWLGCGLDADRDVYAGSEPFAPNVTRNSNRATIKWSTLIAAATPMPTTANPNCANCDSQPSPVAVGTVGAFEGGRFFHCGIYRPEYHCKMRDYGGFCAVCRSRIRATLSPYLGACYAPVFAGSTIPFCGLAYAAFPIMLLAASMRGDLSSCALRRLVFRLTHCRTGNADPCVPL